MAETTLQRVHELNEQLSKLSLAGVPIELEPRTIRTEASAHDSLQASIQRVETALKLRVELGQDLHAAIDAAPELPPRYRASLKTWLALEDPATALGPLTATARERMDVTRSVGVSMIQPALIFALTFVAFIVLCLVTVPRLESLHAQNWTKPTGVLAVLQAVRDTLPVWGIAIPILFITACVVWARGSSRFSFYRFLPGGTRYLKALRHAGFAEHVATLLDHDMPLDQAMLLADPELGAAYLADHDAAPPLVRWALTNDLGGEPLSSALRFVALTYHQVAEQYAAIWRVVLPAFLSVFLGGSLVLVYGLSLFIPMVDTLKMIASPEQP